jgi:uncharacterized membrane protein
MTKQDRFFKLFLRITGSVALLALIAVAMPYSWMNAIHRWLGLGELPKEPVVGYLARSTSAFYAFFGGLLWCLSFHLHRYRPAIHFLGIAIVVFGAILFIVDLREGLPLWWKICEGPINVIFGVIIFTFSSRKSDESD